MRRRAQLFSRRFVPTGWRIVARAVCVVLCGAAGAAHAAGTDAPDYSSYQQSYRIPFARQVDFTQLESLHLRASLNGGPAHSFLVDTGSTGIVVSADEVPNIDPNAPAGEISYSSSGVHLLGVWTKVTVTFPDSKDGYGRLATAVVPALAVRERRVTGIGVNAAGHKAEMNPQVHMFGIGFGAGREAHPERNPFLNLSEMLAGAMRRGYTITRDGFTLGLTAESIGDGFRFQKLTARTRSPGTSAGTAGRKDWQRPSGFVTVESMRGLMGPVLMDTGLTNMIIAGPDVAADVDVQTGARVTVYLLGGSLRYSFKVGDKIGDKENAVTPQRVTWVRPTHGPFVNTGLRAFAAFDCLYDADGGYFGLRPVKRPQ